MLAIDGAATVQTGNSSPENRRRLPPEHTRFKPGQSGNPGGRPKKERTAVELAQSHAEKAIATLAECLASEDAPWPSKISAAAEILDRGFGRAPASLDVNHKLGISEEFEQFMRALVDRKRSIEPVEIEALPVPAPANDETAGLSQPPLAAE